jgi:hypothetical protein
VHDLEVRVEYRRDRGAVHLGRGIVGMGAGFGKIVVVVVR